MGVEVIIGSAAVTISNGHCTYLKIKERSSLVVHIFIVLESELMFRCNCVVSLISAIDELSYDSRIGGKVLLDDNEVDVPVIFLLLYCYNLHVV